MPGYFRYAFNSATGAAISMGVAITGFATGGPLGYAVGGAALIFNVVSLGQAYYKEMLHDVKDENIRLLKERVAELETQAASPL